MPGETNHFDSTVVDELKRAVEGDVLLPGQDEYEAARSVWNAMIDRRPRLVVRPKEATDVAMAVRFSRRHDLHIAVQGGGHNVVGNGVCDGGVLIDCSSMRSVRVDPKSKTARIEPGATMGDVDTAT